ncbi:hypothetical protein E2C01_074794 [Portunus trituberculatus]|uniref:Uncharacterized protein n=1 Tax=Portunus trituberculatus TaxID=210409 RepID=A0A5B7I4A0_PORTR|nr:hypothetical protein [Portunus trituberculatus]
MGEEHFLQRAAFLLALATGYRSSQLAALTRHPSFSKLEEDCSVLTLSEHSRTTWSLRWVFLRTTSSITRGLGALWFHGPWRAFCAALSSWPTQVRPHTPTTSEASQRHWRSSAPILWSGYRTLGAGHQRLPSGLATSTIWSPLFRVLSWERPRPSRLWRAGDGHVGEADIGVEVVAEVANQYALLYICVFS